MAYEGWNLEYLAKDDKFLAVHFRAKKEDYTSEV